MHNEACIQHNSAQRSMCTTQHVYNVTAHNLTAHNVTCIQRNSSQCNKYTTNVAAQNVACIQRNNAQRNMCTT